MIRSPNGRQTDGEVANAIFRKYGFTTADQNGGRFPQPHSHNHTLFQRATDLPVPARPGPARRKALVPRLHRRPTGQRVLVTPAVERQPVTTISLADPNDSTSTPSTSTTTSCAPRSDSGRSTSLGPPPFSGQVTTDQHLEALGDRDFRRLSGQSSTLLLTTPADGLSGPPRTTAVLATRFSRCTGEADVERLGAILRVSDVVTIRRRQRPSGSWLVWNVPAHVLDSSKIELTLVRDAMGPAAAAARSRPFAAPDRPDRGGVAVTPTTTARSRTSSSGCVTRFYGKYQTSSTTSTRQRYGSRQKVPRSRQPRPARACHTSRTPGRTSITFLPESSSGVWIEFEGGDISYPI